MKNPFLDRPLIVYAPDMTRVRHPSLSLYLYATISAHSWGESENWWPFLDRITAHVAKHPRSALHKAFYCDVSELLRDSHM